MKTKKSLFSRRAVACFAILPFFLAACRNDQPVVEGSSEPVALSSFEIKRPDFTPDYVTYEVTAMPSGINMSYYSDIYSRGFSYLTDADTEDTELYLVKSDKGQEADFTGAIPVTGSSIEVTYSQGVAF